jgi:hypothetical protein
MQQNWHPLAMLSLQRGMVVGFGQASPRNAVVVVADGSLDIVAVLRKTAVCGSF